MLCWLHICQLPCGPSCVIHVMMIESVIPVLIQYGEILPHILLPLTLHHLLSKPIFVCIKFCCVHIIHPLNGIMLPGIMPRSPYSSRTPAKNKTILYSERPLQSPTIWIVQGRYSRNKKDQQATVLLPGNQD